MLKRNLKLVQATRSAGAIPIAVNEPILVSRRFNSMDPDFQPAFYRFHLLSFNCLMRWARWEECGTGLRPCA